MIWTHELNFPKLLSNDADLFIKSPRFRLEKIEPFIGQNEMEFSGVNIRKHYMLTICPARIQDNGWYSCSIVKKNLNDRNVKYYTYLSVTKRPSEDDEYLRNEDSYDESSYEYQDFEQRCKDKDIIEAAHFESNSIDHNLEEDSKSIYCF